MLRIKQLFLCLAMLLASTTLRALPEELLNKSYLEVRSSLDTLYDYFSEHTAPIQHLDVIRVWTLQAEDAGDIRLANQLKLISLSASNDVFSGNRQTKWLLELNQVVEYAKKNQEDYLLVDAYMALGHYWRALDKFGKSLEAYHSAYTVYKDLSPNVFPDICMYQYRLSLAYYRLQDYSSTVKYLKELLTYDEALERVNSNAIYNTIGLGYRYLEQYDSATVYFEKILEEARATNNNVWIGIAGGNLGITYYYQGKYDEAIPLLETDIVQSMKSASFIGAAKSMLIRSEIHVIKKEFDTARIRLLKARDLLIDRANYTGPISLEIQQGVYALLAKISAQYEDHEQAYIYADSALIFKDSVTLYFNATKLASAQQKINVLEEELTEEAFIHDREIYLLIRNVLIGGVIVLLIIGGLLVNRQKLKQRSLQTELTIASRRLRDFTQSIHEKNELIEQFSKTKSKKNIESSEVEEEETEEYTETILELRQAILLTDEQWDEFKALFEKVHKGFFYKLTKAFPSLTPAEIRFLTLAKLKLSPKEMASMLGISDNAIRLYRHRLRKKLDLNDDQTVEGIVDFITY